MRKFEPKQFYELLNEGDKYEAYYKYLAEYIVEYFRELAEEMKVAVDTVKER